MTQIVKYTPIEQRACELMPVSLQPFVLAKQSPKLRDLASKDAKVEIFRLMGEFVLKSGHANSQTSKDNQAILMTLSDEIYNYCLDRHKGITIKELEQAFRYGIIEVEYFGYGLPTWTKFINAYMTGQKRLDAMKEFHKQQDIAMSERPVTDMFKPNFEIAEDCFNSYQMNKNMFSKNTLFVDPETEQVFMLNIIFDFLFNSFVIAFSDESKESINQQAKVAYNAYLQGLKKAKPNEYRLLVDLVLNEENRSFDNYRQMFALKVLFDGLLSRGKKLTDLKRKC